MVLDPVNAIGRLSFDSLSPQQLYLTPRKLNTRVIKFSWTNSHMVGCSKYRKGVKLAVPVYSPSPIHSVAIHGYYYIHFLNPWSQFSWSQKGVLRSWEYLWFLCEDSKSLHEIDWSIPNVFMKSVVKYFIHSILKYWVKEYES